MIECSECDRKTKNDINKCHYCLLSNKSFMILLLLIGLVMAPVSFDSFISALIIGVPGTLLQAYQALILWMTSIVSLAFIISAIRLSVHYGRNK